jgi:hypothetical protein
MKENAMTSSSPNMRFNQFGMEISPPPELVTQVPAKTVRSIVMFPIHQLTKIIKSTLNWKENINALDASSSVTVSDGSNSQNASPLPTIDLLAKYRYKFMR